MTFKTLTRCLLTPCVLLFGGLAHSAADSDAAIADCRAKYAEQPPEHIACLERELQALAGARHELARPSLGAEQLRTKRSEQPEAPVTVEIKDVTYRSDGMAVFRMADGQVWKASESTPPERRLQSGKTYAARIERGKLGGYRMYVDGVPRMIKVTRVQ